METRTDKGFFEQEVTMPKWMGYGLLAIIFLLAYGVYGLQTGKILRN